MKAGSFSIGLALLLTWGVSASAQNLTGGEGGGDPPPVDTPAAQQRRAAEVLADRLLSGDPNFLMGGPDTEASVRTDPRTRRQAAKEVIRKVFTSYLDRDIFGFFKYLSPEALLSAGVVRQAIQEDFQQISEVNIDIELLEFRMTFDTVCTRFLWRRVTTDQTTGIPANLQGNCQFCMQKNGDMRVDRVIGLPPFGLTDPTFLAQVIAGQPQAPAGPKGYVLALGLLIAGKPVFVNLDTGALREAVFDPVGGPGGRGGFVPVAGDDLLLIPIGGGGLGLQASGNNVQGMLLDQGGGGLGDFRVSTVNTISGQNCTGDRRLSEIGRVTEASLSPSVLGRTFDTGVHATNGYKTTGGDFALVEFTLPNQIEVKIGPDPQVNPGIDSECVGAVIPRR